MKLGINATELRAVVTTATARRERPEAILVHAGSTDGLCRYLCGGGGGFGGGGVVLLVLLVLDAVVVVHARGSPPPSVSSAFKGSNPEGWPNNSHQDWETAVAVRCQRPRTR